MLGLMFALCLCAHPLKTAHAQFDLYEPYVVVDIGRFIYDAESFTVTAGEAMDVNDGGYAVGWYDDSGDTTPFVFDPTDGGALMDINLTGYTEAKMIAINNATSLDDIVIAGWVQSSTGPVGFEAAYWTWDSVNDEWDTSLIYSSTRRIGCAYDVNIDGDITGYHIPTSDEQVFYYDMSAGTASNWGDGIGYSINDSGWICGDDPNNTNKGFAQTAQSGARTTLIGSSPHNGVSRARAINNDGDVVGGSGAALSSLKVWTWPYNSGWGTGANPSVPSTYTKAIAESVNDEGEVIGTYENPSIDGGFYVLYDAGSWQAEDLDGNAIFPEFRLEDELSGPVDPVIDPVVDRCYSINENAWIAGSFRPDDGDTDYRPCVLVQNDFDSDGEPDLREILKDDEDDDNDNMLIDWAENDSSNTNQYMRIGLHSPGDDPSEVNTDDIDDVQIIRLGYALTLDCGSTPTCMSCGNNFENLKDWANPEAEVDQREIIVRVKTPLVCNDPKHDYVPEDNDRQDLLDEARVFAYRTAGTIDYLQMGNESFTGAQRFAFYANQVTGVSAGTVFTDLTYSQIPEATELIFDWYHELVEVTRQASALTGLPARFVTPAHPMGNINFGYTATLSGDIDSDEEAAAYVVDATCKFGNEERAFFDLHAHYIDDTDVGDTVDNLLDGNAPWENPVGLMCLELGPKADTSLQWFSDNRTEIFQFFEPNGNTGNFTDYDELIREWEDEQFGTGTGFNLGGVLDTLEGDEFTVVCYGPSMQHKMDRDGSGNLQNGDGPDAYDLAALWAQEVKTNHGDPTNLFSVVKDDYETAASTRVISNFTPNPLPFDKDRACPGCGF